MGKIITTLAVSLAFQCAVSASDTMDATRFSLNNTSEFIKKRSELLTINRRDIDPFGQPQDLTKKIAPTKKTHVAPKKKVEILIEQEIHKLGKQNINVFKRNLMINGTPYKRNDQINVIVRGKRFPLKINSFTRSKITFLDLTNKKLISLKLDNGVFLPLDEVNPELPKPNGDIEL